MAYNPSAITDKDIDVYASHISGPGGLKGAFDHFRAFPTDALQNKESATHKITMPVLVLGGDIYPALGGDLPGNFALELNTSTSYKCKRRYSSTFRTLDSRRAADFVIKQLAAFFNEG